MTTDKSRETLAIRNDITWVLLSSIAHVAVEAAEVEDIATLKRIQTRLVALIRDIDAGRSAADD